MAFDPAGLTPLDFGIQVTNKLVKYLGTFLGTDESVEQLNFEMIKRKMQVKADCWCNRVITLQARILVVKVLLFSYCTHILNTTYISSRHLDQIQHFLNDFL